MNIPPKVQTDLYSLVTFARIAQEFGEMLLRETYPDTKDKVVGGQGRDSIQFITSACRSFYSRIKSGIPEESRAGLDSMFLRDFMAWAAIFESLVKMTDEQILTVEMVCEHILAGDFIIENNEENNSNQKEQKESSEQPGNPDNDIHGQTDDARTSRMV